MKKGFFISGGILFIILGTFYFFQDHLIFRSEGLDRNHVFRLNRPFEEKFVLMDDNTEINVLWFKPEAESKGLVLYFHGNAGNLQRWGNMASDLTDRGYEVVMMDYRGYGKSGGEPGEESIIRDSRSLHQWALSQRPGTRIILYGRSLGSFFATRLAADVQPDMLILETPFDELKGAVPEWIRPLLRIVPLRYKLPTKDFLTRVGCKKLIFHGTSDQVVPLESALRLKPLLKETDEFIIITGGTHRNLRTYEVYQGKLTEVLK